MNSEKTSSSGIIIVLFITLAAHLQLLFNDFHTDDWEILIVMRDGFNWRAFLSMEKLANFRPFVNIIIYLRSLFFDNIAALWYALNIGLHLVAVYLVYKLTCQLANRWAAVIAALVFGLYFQHFEAVLWLYGIVRLVAAILILPALIYYFRFKQSAAGRDLIKSYIFFALALFTVEDSIIFALFFAGDLLITKPRLNHNKYYALGYFGLVGIYMLLRFWAIGPGNPSTDYFFLGAHGLANFYSYCVWIILPQLNHPYLIAAVSKYLPFLSINAGAVSLAVFIVFMITSIMIFIKGNLFEKTMLMFLLLSLVMPSFLDTKVSTKLLYLPSIGAAAIAGSLLGRFWQWQRSKSWVRAAAVGVFVIYLSAQAIAINGTIRYYRITQANVRQVVNELTALDMDWQKYNYMILENLPGRTRPGFAIKYLMNIDIHLILSNEETENLPKIESSIADFKARGISYILIDFQSGQPVILER